MSKKKSNEPRARDLMPEHPPGSAPAPVDPEAVMRADDPLEPDVETRKVGIRRVHALGFGNRMYARANRRSAGNSRKFWRQIEADDPFLARPARPTDMPLEIYPSQRLDRATGSMPKPQPDVARAYPPESRQARQPAENRPKPKREVRKEEARRPPKPPPEPTHTPEPRPAPPPVPEPEVEEVPEPVAATPPPGRRLPPKPPPKRGDSGRMRTGGRQRMPSRAGSDRPSAAEIRERKKREREAAQNMSKKAIFSDKTLDDFREFMQNLELQRAAYEAGEEIPTAFADVVDDAPRRPKPKGEVKRVRPKAEAAPEPPPAPVDRTPPKPKAAPKKAEPVNRSPSGKGAGLDDLFGGAQEGRVRIGKRSKPSDEPGE